MDYMQSYEKTDYILSTFKNRFMKDTPPTFEMLGRLLQYVENAYRFKLPAFEVCITDEIVYKSATDIKCKIKIWMAYRKYYNYEEEIYDLLK